MRTVIKGYNKEVTYRVDDGKNKDGKFEKKPALISEETKKTYENICSFHGDYVTNKNSMWFSLGSYGKINISETEEVEITKSIFRADLNEQHVFVEKVLNTKEVNRYDSEMEYDKVMKEFNKTMIESDEKLHNYCKLHKLDPEETDVIELFAVAYPKDTDDYYYTYEIKDGKFLIRKIDCGKIVISSADLNSSAKFTTSLSISNAISPII